MSTICRLAPNPNLSPRLYHAPSETKLLRKRTAFISNQRGECNQSTRGVPGFNRFPRSNRLNVVFRNSRHIVAKIHGAGTSSNILGGNVGASNKSKIGNLVRSDAV